MSQKKIGIVLINYFNDEEVISFIRNQLFAQTNKEIQIYVQDNGSSNNFLKFFCLNEPAIIYNNPGKNMGYIGGFLAVVEQLKKPQPEKMVLSNTDIVFHDVNLLENIAAFEFKAGEVMIGPDVVSSRTGKSQNPFYEEKISDARLKLLSVVFSSWIAYALYQVLGILKAMIKGSSRNKNVDTGHVYAIHGSFMIFKTSFVQDHLKELSDAPFLFGEEIQFAELAARKNLKTLYCPQFKVRHHEHATTKLFKSRKMLKMLKESVDFRIRKRKEEQG